MIGIPSHHSFNFSWKFGWSNQKFLKWKGLRRLGPTFSHSSLMGQWFDPVEGRTDAFKSPSYIITDSVTKKRSSLHVIPLSPILLLFQVKLPLLVLTSTRLRVSITSLKVSDMGFSWWIPPFFSSRILMTLKSPPRIHCFSPDHWLSFSREWIKDYFGETEKGL